MNQKQFKKLPLGISTFSEIIQENYVYVDKTELIYQMVTGGKYYFLSRPRRFGKSLLVSTLAELFSGNKELFKDLWIGQSDYVWAKHPVIKIDFSRVDCSSIKRLEKSLSKQLYAIAKKYKFILQKTDSVKDLFDDLIHELAAINSVVILIDEYDKPILDYVHDFDQAHARRELLRSFYSTIKAPDQVIRFVLLTGVTKFAKTSIFSGLNNLRDITLSEQFSIILGYTADEIHTYLDGHVLACAQKLGKSIESIYALLDEYYDGYCFSVDKKQVYNPFSVLNCLIDQRFGYYWFTTGTPAFLLHVIQSQTHDLNEIEEPVLDEMHLDKIDVERIPLTPLLFQTGYLTITHVDQQTHKFTLNFPNKEVRNAFVSNLVDVFIELVPEQAINYARDIAGAFKDHDLERVGVSLQDLFNKMPYTTHVKNERDVHFIVYCVFKLIGIEVDPEVVTSLGRADLVVSLPQPSHEASAGTAKLVYVIELKFNKTAQEALAQIQDKKYYEKFLNSEKQITLLGINFDSATKIISLAHNTVPSVAAPKNKEG